LEALGAEGPAKTAKAANDVSVPAQIAAHGAYKHRLNVERWLGARGVAYRVKPTPDAKGRTIYLLAECPFNGDHGGKHQTCITQEPDGKLGALCMHNSCAANGWKEFKDKIGAPDGDHYDPPFAPRRQRTIAIVKSQPA